MIRTGDVDTNGHAIWISIGCSVSEENNLYPGFSVSLSASSGPSLGEEYIHHFGHHVLGTVSKNGIFGAARAIQRTIHPLSIFEQS